MTLERTAEPPVDLRLALENYALGFLRQGREWDEPHTRAVVHYAGEIAKAEGLDILVLVSAAWLHDIGYYRMFEEGESRQYEQVMDRKKTHMVNGAKMAADFLNRSEIQPFYTPEQRERVVHLVSVHDNIEELREIDEIAFMEADTLGAIDTERVKPTFDKENAWKYVENDLMLRRYPRFLTKTGVALFNQIFSKFEAYFNR
jgi:putative nucleotidyltransferase with HDIG domain